MNATLAELAALLADQGESVELLGQGGQPITGVEIDSRAPLEGRLFVALRGARFDGHDFVAAALAAGAAAALVERRWWALRQPVGNFLLVEDTRRALGRLAAGWRGCFSGRLVGITGSNGKTTVKEMTAAILRKHFGAESVLATRGNRNNDIGLPLTLLELEPRQRAAVCELGINRPGEMAELAAIARPDVAVVTTAQRAHLEGFGTLDTVAREKGQIYRFLASDGTAVIPADDPHASLWREMAAGRRVLTFGRGGEVCGTAEPLSWGWRVQVRAPGEEAAFTLPLVGRHNVHNALAAMACAVALDVPLATAASALAAFVPVPGRLQPLAGAQGALLIDDTYNANPDSMRAAIEVLAALPHARKLLVLGDMGEVGPEAPRLHAELGAHARAAGIGRLFTLGALAREAASAFGRQAESFDDVEALVQRLRPDLSPETAVLIKGSRFMRMERVVSALAAKAAALQG
ncbi:UDP-N-acetylmuramoyl-tripeptide--D-alanyl-D-alanine ligase [Tepidiphilus margaritifer]|uniref:UDP-N-acetylmuramoyl-tripeptide--D-alanyl-D- alanine ligase n=1 Tax=Tepidiphilus margaritifer TaxID=203471 RepID=UPI00041127EA|nr:UDP-N-acetylmuramoyl-tripeptide--D-alanyl-D-alanine ligase [Tepidiphilus margaritifer]